MSKELLIAPLKYTLNGNIPPVPLCYTWWHGALGKQLKMHFPETFDLLYESRSDQARLYSIQPAFPGNPVLRITLMGPAVGHAFALTQALKWAGRSADMDRQNFSIQSAELESPDGNVLFYMDEQDLIDWPGGIPARRFMAETEEIQQITVQLLTPMILKEGNRVVETAPEFAFFFRRLLGRVAQICHAAESHPLFSKETAAHWLDAASQVRLTRAILREESMSRTSRRTHSRMTFSGLTGMLQFEGELGPFLGMLRVGQKLQMGGKTAFGFGVYKCNNMGEAIE